MKTLLTVFTPTYNRKHTLGRTYLSLCSQSCKDFIWLIIDDGSNDGTGEMVSDWQKENNGFEIQYQYKKNGGMHTAHNLAYDLIETELNVCIDSDDMLAENAIKKIIDTWGTIRQDGYAGIIGLDSDFDNHIIGTSFTKEKEAITLSEFYDNGGRGDKKLVYRTSIMKELSRYPEFIGEKLVPLSYKYILCDQKYKLYPINEILCNVEYQANGSTGRIWKQYLESPRGFAEYRKLRMRYSHNKLRIIIDCLHYIANSISAKKKYWIRDSPYPFMTFILLPFGILFLLYIHYKALS